jgi:hypothetical protein
VQARAPGNLRRGVRFDLRRLAVVAAIALIERVSSWEDLSESLPCPYHLEVEGSRPKSHLHNLEGESFPLRHLVLRG